MNENMYKWVKASTVCTIGGSETCLQCIRLYVTYQDKDEKSPEHKAEDVTTQWTLLFSEK